MPKPITTIDLKRTFIIRQATLSHWGTTQKVIVYHYLDDQRTHACSLIPSTCFSRHSSNRLRNACQQQLPIDYATPANNSYPSIAQRRTTTVVHRLCNARQRRLATGRVLKRITQRHLMPQAQQLPHRLEDATAPQANCPAQLTQTCCDANVQPDDQPLRTCASPDASFLHE